MADDVKNDMKEESTETPKTYSEDELNDRIQKAVKDRLKNLHAKNADLEARLAEVQSVAPTPEAQNELQTASVEMPQNAIDQNNLSSMLDNKFQDFQKQQQAQQMEQQIQQAQAYSNSQVDKMNKEDPEFAKLASKDNQLGVDGAVVTHLTNNLDYKNAKKILKELLTNENANLKMNNALLLDKANNDNLATNYTNWLNSMMQAHKNEEPTTAAVPDLSAQETYSNDDSSSENLDDYIKNL